MSRTHLPAGDGVLCGSTSFVAACSIETLCARCVRVLHNIFEELSDGQLRMFNLERASVEEKGDGV